MGRRYNYKAIGSHLFIDFKDLEKIKFPPSGNYISSGSKKIPPEQQERKVYLNKLLIHKKQFRVYRYI
jgi:hypothetical protein